VSGIANCPGDGGGGAYGKSFAATGARAGVGLGKSGR